MSLIARLGNGGDYENPSPPSSPRKPRSTYDMLENYAYFAEKNQTRRASPSRKLLPYLPYEYVHIYKCT